MSERERREERQQPFFSRRSLFSEFVDDPHTVCLRWMLSSRRRLFSTVHSIAFPATMSPASARSAALAQPAVEPPVNRGMRDLDRSKFTQTLNVLAARVPASRTTQFLKHDAKE